MAEVKDTGKMADGWATVSKTTVAADVHRDSSKGQIDHNDTCSPQQTKVFGSKSKAFKPAPLSILPPGETYTSDTLPSETMHAAGKVAVSPKNQPHFPNEPVLGVPRTGSMMFLIPDHT